MVETTTQLFSHHTMKEESFNVDAFNERDNTGVLGRMADVLGNSMATAQISINQRLSNLVGDPTLGRKVDIVQDRGNGVEQFYRVDVNNGVSHCYFSLRSSILFHVSWYFSPHYRST